MRVLLLLAAWLGHGLTLRLGDCVRVRDGELRCGCSAIASGSGGGALLSQELNPVLAAQSSGGGREVHHLILAGCSSLRLTLDTARLDRTATDLTDISFEDMESLSLKFVASPQGGRRFVFTDIERVELSGQLGDRSDLSGLAMFFRRLERTRSATVILLNLRAEAPVRLLNFQDIEHLRVVDSSFSRISTLEIIHSGFCHTRLEGDQTVPCTKEDLFGRSGSEAGREDTGATVETFPPFRPSYTKIPASTLEAERRTQEVTSGPLFIVGMVLLATVVIIAILVFFFLRYQKKRDLDGGLLR